MMFLPIARIDPRPVWAAGLATALTAAIAGCGTPGAPQPPSLLLPDRVDDLAAVRSGNQVTLSWKMPRRTTDHVNLRGPLTVRICRQEPGMACQPLATQPNFAPGTQASFNDALPAELASGPARPLNYFVELPNQRTRSAGLSNAASVLAGAAPAAVEGLTAEMHPEGVALGWQAPPSEPGGVLIRLHRRLLTPPATQAKNHDLLTAAPKAAEQTLLVDAPARPGHAVDRSAPLGARYEYRAQRVARVEIDGKTLELAGPLTEPIEIEARDLFPPAAPTGLVAVATAASAGSAASIDLNWQPNTEAALAGYVVYRAGEDGSWVRVSPATPLTVPAFRDEAAEPGRTWRYAVTAIGQNGRESARSAEASEALPQP